MNTTLLRLSSSFVLSDLEHACDTDFNIQLGPQQINKLRIFQSPDTSVQSQVC